MIVRTVRQVENLKHPYLVKSDGCNFSFLLPMGTPLGELLNDLKLTTDNLRGVQVEDGNLEDVFRKLTTENMPAGVCL